MGAIVSLEDRRPKPRAGGNNKGTRRRFGNLRKLPSKRWQASYQGPDGKRHNAPTTFQTKGDAETWLNLQDAAITEHRWRPPAPAEPDRTPFTTYAERWLAGRELKPRTRSEYRKMLDKITPEFAGVPLVDVTPELVRSWYAGLDPAHPTERAHRYALLRTILGAAVEEELIPMNPAHIRGAGSAKRARQIRPASLEELQTITDAMPESEQLLILLSAWCALRFGEVTELRRGDIDMKNGLIRVRRGVTWVKGADPGRPDLAVPVVGTPKSDAGVRDVTIPPHILPAVRKHLAEHAEKGRDGLLFHAQDGTHLNHGTIYKHFTAARKAAGRPDLRLHDLRHTGAVMAAQAGATTRELMDRLGHTTAGVAMRYQHVADGRAAELARKLSAMATGTDQ